MQTSNRSEEESRRLVGQLKSVRQSHASGSPDALREALRVALREAMGSISADEARRRIEGARDIIVEEARHQEERTATVTAEAASLREEVARLRADRDRLLGENVELRRAPGGGAAASAASSGGSNGALEKIRAGLRQIADGRSVTADEIGLPASEARFFRLVSALLGFALNYEMSRQGLLNDFQVGPGGGMNTMMIRQHKRLIGKRFRACLDDEQGSVQALSEALSRNSRFLLDLNKAYEAAFQQGPPVILKSLDPQPLVDEFTGKFGMVDQKSVLQKLTTIHSDLTNQTATDNWDLYFKGPFVKKLADHLNPSEEKG